MLTYRSSGILLPVSSLPGPYGVGSMGTEARNFIDFLSDAGQGCWQILPLVPPGGGDSPYMSASCFAGNPYFLDLDELAKEGMVTREELDENRFENPDRIDYVWLHRTRPALLRRVWERGRTMYQKELRDFMDQEADWLSEYAFFMALRGKFGGAELKDWPEAVRTRQPEAMVPLYEELSQEIEYHSFLQFLFFRQWEALKAYANKKHIRIIGDMPIYVSPDSAEVWAHPDLFQVDDQYVPTAVAGVPPDAFSDEGQHWGNPLYNWEHHKATGFAWWRRRGEHMARLYDIVRIDHFRAFHTYWSIPLGAKSAKEGHWVPGPGMALVDALNEIPDLTLIAEDLGDLDEEARAFIAKSGLPGMKILIYAFDPVGESAYLPHNCTPNSIIYTGTHDTPTFVEWLFDEATPEERKYAFDYLRLRDDEGYGWGAVCGAWASPSLLAMVPMQDLLCLGGDARVNTPGTMGPHNWSWRVRRDAFNTDVSGRLRHITRTYRRCL